MRPDARPQARKNRRRIRWNTLRIFQDRERRRWLRIVRRSRTVNVGQAPRDARMPPNPLAEFAALEGHLPEDQWTAELGPRNPQFVYAK
jgi:hypothetical protein